jgi:hypothetical protein
MVVLESVLEIRNNSRSKSLVGHQVVGQGAADPLSLAHTHPLFLELTKD